MGKIETGRDKLNDNWHDGDPYEAFMGRWSYRMSKVFIDWLDPGTDLHWLDVGCGTGALSEVIATTVSPASIVAVDLSEGFVKTATERLGSSAQCVVGDATSLQLEESIFDYVVSALTLNFIAAPDTALKEMKRVATDGAVIATFVWDYAGEMEMLKYFWDSVVELNPDAADMHESTRFAEVNADTIEQYYKSAGLKHPVVEKLRVQTVFGSFDDYWQPFLGGQGPGPAYVQSLGAAEIQQLADSLKNRLPIQNNGEIVLHATALAAQCHT